MRARLYHFCKHNNFNLTTNYGLDPCKPPFSCIVGKKIYFTYGHNAYFNPGSVGIMMLREPLSWLFSRNEHKYRQDHSFRTSDGKKKTVFMPTTMVTTSVIFEYLRFLPNGPIFDGFAKWIKICDAPLRAPQRNKTDMVDVSVDTNELVDVDIPWLLKQVEQLFSENVVLLTEHYEMSLDLLSFGFRGSFQINDTSEVVTNSASQWQESLSAGSVRRMKQITLALEPLYAIYNLALAEFFRELSTMKRLKSMESTKQSI